ncbi:mismatch-specific DNA-glycosylase [Radiobacillus sp. PE A8.2]|uniref:mismatch-specific DNA-glycosylase n=1 Tax=Radiobacillus sp. PE A8.2 TaxID=3380349 RepID=UPI0038908CD5
MLKPIPDHLTENLNLLFVGFNPSIRSAETGHHYANPNNRFWTILYEADLTPTKFSTEQDQELIAFGYGLTNIVARPTADITKEEYEQGRDELHAKIHKYKPKIVCFVGKGVYQQYSKSKKIPWGKQESPVISEVVDFVAPSSSGLVRMKLTEIVDIYKQLHDYL